MPQDTKEVYVNAELTIGSDTQQIIINSLSMTTAITQMKVKLKPFQRAVLKLFADNGNCGLSPYKPIKTTIGSSNRNENDRRLFDVEIKFSGIPKVSQGVVQLMNTPSSAPSDSKLEITATNNSLRVELVSCHMCKQEDIPFWILQSRAMVSKANIFGVPIYLKEMPKRDFCDYNLLRVIVCPNCYFASNDISQFMKTSQNNLSDVPFNTKEVCLTWNDEITKRKNLIYTEIDGLFGESRSVDQALTSYDLGIITSDAIFKSDEHKDPRSRNYDPARKSVFYLMFKAEVLIANDRKKEAEELLEQAIARLEEIFPLLSHEPCIRAVSLLGMLHLYFENYRKVGQYLTFLREFNNKGKIKIGSSEEKALSSSTKKLDNAFQERNEYSKNSLNDFRSPF